jgi:putative cardiolipin synthase
MADVLPSESASSAQDTVKSVSGPSGLLIVAENRDAFALRVLAAREAVSTLDLMYYIWRDDHCGRLLMREVLAAADRGVRVRLLIDDINPQASDAKYLLVDDHPNIELKLFNPSGMRRRGLARALELVVRVHAMTRRMHCKAWIADGKLAIAGGRNIGDEYFDAAETNFRDIDLLMTGHVVEQASAVFEAYWNYTGSWPISLLNPAKPQKRKAKRKPSKLETDEALGPSRSIADYLTSNGPMHEVERARLIADPPEKAAGQRRGNWMMNEVRPVIQGSRERLRIVSPYFVPGRVGVGILSELVERGVDAAVVTNSLAATDVAAVHGGYANYRRKLLRRGVRLFEFQRSAETPQISVFGSKGASLHTKAFIVDGSHGFVGSLNFDPRSASLNTEMGVLFENEGLASELQGLFEHDMSPSTSYRVWLERGRLLWEGIDSGRIRRFSSEPKASLRRRLVAFIVRWLPMESQL